MWSEQAEEPAVRMRQAITRLSNDATTSENDLLSLRIAAVDLASLIVQLAANAAASGRAGEAPEQRSAPLDATLSAVTGELAARAQEVERPAMTVPTSSHITSRPVCGSVFRRTRCSG